MAAVGRRLSSDINYHFKFFLSTSFNFSQAFVHMKPLFVLSCLLCSLSLLAQTVRRADISGIVHDTNGAGLTGSTVMLLAAKDSVLTSFAATGANGGFVLKNVQDGNYILKVSYVGFEAVSREIQVGESAELNIGTIVLSPASEVLSEVEVTADHIPIQIKKDTIEYNAEAFQTQPNAVVEDLLKKLPGIEVGTDGSIKAQGEDVQNVLVDGKEFFGTDPKVATKNLPANSVKKVRVYDKMSEMAEFSGVDDGDREKTINLELKEDFKTGLFGTAEAGYGSDSRHMVKASINKFTKKSQLSVLGLLNNINEQGFSFEEYMNFSGGMRSFGRGGGGRGGAMQITLGDGDVPISQGLGNGLTKTFAGGVNYNFDIGNDLDVRSSYFYNGVNNDLLQNTFRQGFLTTSTYDTYEDTDQNSENEGHRLNLRAEYEIDSTQNFELRSTATVGSGEGESFETQETFGSDQVLQNTGEVTNAQSSDRLNFSGDLYYRKKLGKKGRSLAANQSLNSSDDDGESRLMAINEYLTTGNTDVLDQFQTTVADNMQWGGEFSFTEPIAKKQYLEFGYEYESDEETSVRDAYDIDSLGNSVPNDLLSTRFERDLAIHRIGATWRLNSEKSTMSAGLEFQDTGLDGFVNDGEMPIQKHLQSYLPNFRWRYELSTSRSFRIDYRTAIRVPSISQLSPVIDNSDPLNIYIGNPDLKAEYSHVGSLHFHSFSQFSFTSLFAMITGTLMKNKIVNGTSISEAFIETVRPINIDNDYLLSGYASFGTPLKFIKTRLQINANVSYNKSLIPVNNVNNDFDRLSGTIGLQFQNQNSDVFEYTFGSNWTQSKTQYSESTQQNQDFFTHHYFGDVTVNFLKSWSASTSMDYRLYTGDQFEEDQALPIWKASLSKFVMEGKRGQIKLSVFDLLDENKGISRTSNANYLEEIRANSIGRYVMLSFLYSIKGFGENAKQGGMRFIQDRR